MKFIKKFSLLETIIAVAVLALLAAIVLPRIAKAQPYFTNSSPIYGAQTYNQTLPTPINPAVTLANQYAAGTLVGSFLGGQDSAYAAGFYTFTNMFATNIYTAPPIMVYTIIGGGTNAIASSTVTTTNFTFTTTGTNGVTINWEATGH